MRRVLDRRQLNKVQFGKISVCERACALVSQAWHSGLRRSGCTHRDDGGRSCSPSALAFKREVSGSPWRSQLNSWSKLDGIGHLYRIPSGRVDRASGRRSLFHSSGSDYCCSFGLGLCSVRVAASGGWDPIRGQARHHSSYLAGIMESGTYSRENKVPCSGWLAGAVVGLLRFVL